MPCPAVRGFKGGRRKTGVDGFKAPEHGQQPRVPVAQHLFGRDARVAVKSLSAFEPQTPFPNHPFQQGRRRLIRRKPHRNLTVIAQHKIKPGEIQSGQVPHHGKARAQTDGNGIVQRRRVRHALVEKLEQLLIDGPLDTVDDEAAREALEHHRLHAQCGQAGGELRDELSGIGRMTDDFDEGNDVRWHKVVRHDQLGMQDGRSVFEDVEDGGVAGYQGRRGHDAGQFLVKTALDVHPFRNDFDDELGPSRRSESVLRKPQPGHDAFRRFSSQLLGLRARKSADGPFRPDPKRPGRRR